MDSPRQAPQLAPQPSGPQFRSTQSATQQPPSRHTLSAGHWPQLAPHPSGPHSRSLQSGTQQRPSRQTDPGALQTPHDRPQPSGPHSLPAQAGSQPEKISASRSAAPLSWAALPSANEASPGEEPWQPNTPRRTANARTPLKDRQNKKDMEHLTAMAYRRVRYLPATSAAISKDATQVGAKPRPAGKAKAPGDLSVSLPIRIVSVSARHRKPIEPSTARPTRYRSCRPAESGTGTKRQAVTERCQEEDATEAPKGGCSHTRIPRHPLDLTTKRVALAWLRRGYSSSALGALADWGRLS
jgi:hypothetical protein